MSLGTGIALAPAAGAVEDVARPDYRVVSGPSCHPGGVRIEVVAGTLPYSVVLATTRRPDGEDSAELAPGRTVLLHTGDVDWGETIDSRLEFAALDGSGETFADDLEPYSFTRPAEEDCAAIASTAGGSPAPATVPGTPPAADRGTAGDHVAAADVPAEGPDVDVRVAAAELPVPHERPAWAPIVAGISLVGAAGGLVLESARRRRGSTIAGA